MFYLVNCDDVNRLEVQIDIAGRDIDTSLFFIPYYHPFEAVIPSILKLRQYFNRISASKRPDWHLCLKFVFR